MDMKTMKRRGLIAAGLIGLPVITWALLAWEPFDRLLARVFPGMFYDEVGRFVPLMPVEALGVTIVLTVYAAPFVLATFLAYAMVRSVRRRGAAGTVIRAGRIAYRGSVVVLVAVWGMVLVLAHGMLGFLAFLLEGADDTDDRDRYGCYSGWEHRQHRHENPYSPMHRGLFHHDE